MKGEIIAYIWHLKYKVDTNLKVHKREKFFVSDFEFFTILELVKLKYSGFVKKIFDCAIFKRDRLFRLYWDWGESTLAYTETKWNRL